MVNNVNIEQFVDNIPNDLVEENAIRNFLWRLLDGNEERRTMKMVILGHGQIGKSTLVNYLKYCATSSSASWFTVCFCVCSKPILAIFQKTTHKLTKHHPSKFKPKSTVGINHVVLNIDNSIEVNIEDFAGQLEYTVTHQFFLSFEV